MPKVTSFSDDDLIRLNSVGLSLFTISQLLNCHPTTVTNRLKTRGIAPSDTRRTFMEDVFVMLSSEQQEWLADQLGPTINIKDYVLNLIIEKHRKSKETTS